MRLLHLSDIHFRTPVCLTPHLDPDKAFRTRLEQDLAEFCADGTRVDAVLVGGDIAFKADPREYDAAKEWLLRVAGICGCHTSRIVTVPGNHDVNREACKRVLVSNAQDAIARANDYYARDSALVRQLGEEASAKPLFEPLEAYNEFAAQFECNVFHSRPYWERLLELGQGVQLRIYGLTSIFVSGAGDRDDAPGRLFLGSCQTAIDPDPNVVALVLCHHPPNWFSDASQTANTLDARAKLQFFGHEHDQRCMRVQEYMRFLAGAVNPERDAQAWRPGYNLVDIKVEGEGAARVLEICGHLRHFQSAPNEMFVPLQTSSKESVWKHTIRLPEPVRANFAAESPVQAASASVHRPPQAETKMATAVHAAIDPPPRKVESAAQLPEVKMKEPSTDNLVFRFWQLRVNEMRDIALGLGLIGQGDLTLPPPQRYFKAMEAAKEKGLLVELAREIEKHETST